MSRARRVWVVTAFSLYVAMAATWLLTGLAAAIVWQAPQLRQWVLQTGNPWLAALAAPSEEEQGAQLVFDYLFSTLNIALGLVLFRLRRHSRSAGLLAVAMIGSAAAFNLTAHRAEQVFAATGLDVDLWHVVVFHAVAGVTYVNALITFPGRGPRRRAHRWSIAGLWLANVALFITAMATGTAHALLFVVFYGALTPLVGVVAQAVRSRHAGTPEWRQQSRVMMWALIVITVCAVALAALIAAAGLQGVGGLTAESALDTTFRLCRALFTAIPLAIIVGLLRFRLWDAERLISRTLVYGTLVTLISGVYVGVVVVLSTWMGPERRPGSWTFLGLTMVTAVAFSPLRERATRLVNHMLYGRPSSPYEILSDLSRRAQAAVDIDELLPQMAAVTAGGTGSEVVRVQVRLSNGDFAQASWPTDARADDGCYQRVRAVHDGGERIGDISVGEPAARRLSAAATRLLDDLAAHAGPAMRTIALTHELRARVADTAEQAVRLRASCARIVAAGDAARQRLDRDLHDGAQQLLVALRVHLSVFEQQRAVDPTRALELLDLIRGDAEAALSQLEDLASGLYPATLAERGVPGALRSRCERVGIAVQLEIDPTVQERRFDAEVESAVYFCCLEAIQNAAKHAGGEPVSVRMSMESTELVFSVSDGGRGFDRRTMALSGGSGLANMADRIAAVGGEFSLDTALGRGVRIAARIPLPRLHSPITHSPATPSPITGGPPPSPRSTMPSRQPG